MCGSSSLWESNAEIVSFDGFIFDYNMLSDPGLDKIRTLRDG